MDLAALDVIGFAVVPDLLDCEEAVVEGAEAVFGKGFADGAEVHGVLNNLRIISQPQLLPRHRLPKLIRLWLFLNLTNHSFQPCEVLRSNR